MPGLEEQPVRGLQGLKEGAYLWGEGAGQDGDLSPSDTHPLPPPISASTQSSPASQATHPTLPPPSTTQVPAVGSKGTGYYGREVGSPGCRCPSCWLSLYLGEEIHLQGENTMS